MGEQKNISELRFPGYDDGWKSIKIGDIADFKAGYAFKSNLMLPEKSRYQIIKMSNVYKNELRLDRSPSYWYEIDKKQKEFILNKGDSILTLTGTVNKRDYGYSVIINENEKYLLNQRLVRLREKENISINEFLYIIISHEKFLDKFFNEAKGGTGNQANVGTEDIKKIKVVIPSLPEQQKIASFFTAIDKKISLLKQKKTLLEQYKKGVMQKIFSQQPDEGGSRTPIKNKQAREQIRFRDENGQEFPKWVKKKFKEVYSFKTTNSFSRDNLNYESGEVRNIHYGDIHTKYPILFDITKHELPYINSDISITKIKEDSYCINNDLVFADASEDVPDVGKCIELVNLNSEKVLAGLHTILARPNELQLAGGFGGYLMASIGIRKQIMKISQGSKVTSISSSRLGEIEIDLPCTEEQSNIANFLSAVDTKINHTQTQIENAERWKKGLLQKMFV